MDSVLDEVRSVIGDVLDRGDGSWRTLQEAGLLSLAAPTKLGGEGLGMVEVSVLLHVVGRRAVELPVWETLACGLLPLVRSGSEALQADLVPKVLAGELLLAPALGELGAALPISPATAYDDEASAAPRWVCRFLMRRRCCSSPPRRPTAARRSLSSTPTVRG